MVPVVTNGDFGLYQAIKLVIRHVLTSAGIFIIAQIIGMPLCSMHKPIPSLVGCVKYHGSLRHPGDS